jgi:hypothetical protein
MIMGLYGAVLLTSCREEKPLLSSLDGSLLVSQVALTATPLSTTGNINEIEKCSEFEVSVVYNNVSGNVSAFGFL